MSRFSPLGALCGHAAGGTVPASAGDMHPQLSLRTTTLLIPSLLTFALACGDGSSDPEGGLDAGMPDAAPPALQAGDIDPTVGTEGWFDFERGVDVLVALPQERALVLAGSIMAIVNSKAPMEVIEADHPPTPALNAYVDPSDGDLLFQTDSGWRRYDDALSPLSAPDTSAFRYTSDAIYLDDGRLLIFGSVDDMLTVVRYLKNGDIDTSFGAAGVATISAEFELRSESISVGADGSIWLGCSRDFTPCATKLSADGSSASELVVLDMGPRYLRDIVATDDGGAVVLGMVFDDIQLAKLNAQGELDLTLGEDGIVSHDIPLPFEEGFEARELVADGNDGFYLHGTYSIRGRDDIYSSKSETWLFHVGSSLAVDGHFAGRDKVVIDYNRDGEAALSLSSTKSVVVMGEHLFVGGRARNKGGVINTIGRIVVLRR